MEKAKIIGDGILNQFIRELKIQSFLEHSNVIKLYTFFHDAAHFYIILEYGCCGQLYQLMNQRKGFSELTTSFLGRHLLRAVNYMHEHKIFHRDIKP